MQPGKATRRHVTDHRGEAIPKIVTGDYPLSLSAILPIKSRLPAHQQPARLTGHALAEAAETAAMASRGGVTPVCWCHGPVGPYGPDTVGGMLRWRKDALLARPPGLRSRMVLAGALMDPSRIFTQHGKKRFSENCGQTH